MSILSSLTSALKTDEKRVDERELIRREAEIGSQLFGPVPAGHRREFFCLDSHTWIWYEEWKDIDGKIQSSTTRYEISHRNILKIQDGKHPQHISLTEAETFAQAISKYYQLVSKHVYGLNV